MNIDFIYEICNFFIFSAVGLRHYYGCAPLPVSYSLVFDYKHEFLRELWTQLAIKNKHKVSFKADLPLRQF